MSKVRHKLGVDEALAAVTLPERARRVTEAMTLSRFIAPSPDHAMPDWIRRTALPDILGAERASVHDETLNRNPDELHRHRAAIERGLAQRERTLFTLDSSVHVGDLTSTCFECQFPGDPQAQWGYPRDQRPDCKQVLVVLVLDGDGFSRTHEVFDGNRTDQTTVPEKLSDLERRVRADGPGHPPEARTAAGG